MDERDQAARGEEAAAAVARGSGLAIAFRPADSADAPELGRLARLIWDEAYAGILERGQIDYMLKRMYSPERIAEELREGIAWCLIFLGGTSCGFLSYGPGGEGRAKIHKLYLAAPARGRGVASMAIARVEVWAREEGRDLLTLNVNRENHRAIRAYGKNGFRVERSEIFDIGDGYVMDDHIMVKPVPARAPRE
ncbi:MAG: GNAT family N-acetyltransferase [Spirochaetes bacterium]|nr:GNAT family N-acetyltransferase [Spirochaetota bacterium]